MRKIDEPIAVSKEAQFYIDCEFDGHNGVLLSMALVRDDGDGIHIRTRNFATDEWVKANVVPLLDAHAAPKSAYVSEYEVGGVIRAFIGDCERPLIIADSPVDIGRFCQALSTGPDGGWASADYPAMRFEVHNVDCYPTDLPGAVQHNAWWDAMALRHKLAHLRTPAPMLMTQEWLDKKVDADPVAEVEACTPAGEAGEMVADSGMSGEAVERAEWAWANLPVGPRKWTSLATHEKALVCHTITRLSTTDTEAMRLLRAAAQDMVDAWASGETDAMECAEANLRSVLSGGRGSYALPNIARIDALAKGGVS